MFRVGQTAYDQHLYVACSEFMAEAMLRLAAALSSSSSDASSETAKPEPDPALLLDYWAFCEFKNGNVSAALHLTRRLLELGATSPDFSSSSIL